MQCGKDLLKNFLTKMEITKRLVSICMTIKTKYMSYQKIGVINMDFYGWRIKEWKFNSSNIEEKQQEMKNWIEKWQHKYRIEQIYVNNAWAVQYRLLMKVG